MKVARVSFVVVAGLLLISPTWPARATDSPLAWPGIVEFNSGNWAYPDAWAVYFFHAYELAAGNSFTLTGDYAFARFISFETYSEEGYSTGYIPDLQIAPDVAGQNPFANPAATNGTYTVNIVRPDEATGAANEILTAAASPDGIARGSVTYRLYVTDAGDFYGSVGLPTMWRNVVGQDPQLVPESPVHLPITPDPPLAGLYNPPAMTDPQFFKPDSGSSSLFPNSANAYLGVELELAAGRYFVITGKAPISPDTLDGDSPAMPGQEVRYWSLSTNDNSYLLPVTQTLRDDQVTLDPNGFYKIVIGRAEDIPAGLGSYVTEMLIDFADYTDRDNDGRLEMVLTLRHMLADPSFAYSVQNAPAGPDWLATAAAMGEYYPDLQVLPKPATPPSPVLDSGDYNGDGTDDIAIFRESTGLWAVRGITRDYFGSTSDIPVPGDYDGNETTDIGIFRETSGLWAVKGLTRLYFGSTDDIPVPFSYNPSSACIPGIFRETSGLWALRGLTRVYFGSSGDRPVPGDYAGNGSREIGIFRRSSGLWAIRNLTRVYFGASTDTAVPGDYSGSGVRMVGIFRPASGLWAIRGLTRSYFGGSTDEPVPGDYSVDGTDDIGIFRDTSGLWAVRGLTRTYFGTTGDIPITR